MTKSEQISRRVSETAQVILGDRLKKVTLFGSYARGDYDSESDIDFLVVAAIDQRECRKIQRLITNELGYLGLDLDMVISVTVTSEYIYSRYNSSMGFLVNVQREGVELYA